MFRKILSEMYYFIHNSVVDDPFSTFGLAQDLQLTNADSTEEKKQNPVTQMTEAFEYAKYFSVMFFCLLARFF